MPVTPLPPPEKRHLPEPRSHTASVDARPCYCVALFGLGDRIDQLVDAVVKQARHNDYRYQIGEQGAPVEFDIALVDMTAPGGAAVARTLKDSTQHLPVIGVGRRSSRRSGNDDLLLATFSLDVLGVLNKAARLLSKRAEATRSSSGFTQPREHLELPQVNGRSPRALVIEPSPWVRSQVAATLRQIGVDAEGVGTIAQAEDVLSMRTYELVILEPRQLDGDGLAMLRRLRNGSGLLKLVIPVIVLSSRSGIFDLAKAAWAGCNGFLAKPVTQGSLQSTARRVLRRSLRPRLDAQRKGEGTALLPPTPLSAPTEYRDRPFRAELDFNAPEVRPAGTDPDPTRPAHAASSAPAHPAGRTPAETLRSAPERADLSL